METTTATAREATNDSPELTLERGDVCCKAQSLPDAADDTQMVALTDRLKALADETRLRMLDLLLRHGESLCVCEITEQFDLRQPTISHHLRLLREAGLIHGVKRGTWMYYSATEEGSRSMALLRTLV
jgi:ArsR family transcriptional regulator, arsenate/arsenite/antimonite-responsive transcriptional repressor